jgi:benzoate membrane transport protein
MKNVFSDFSVSTVAAGLIAVLVGYASTAVIVYQAAIASGATPTEASSWLGMICVSVGALSILLSLKYKIPVMFTWSTAGAALLITSVAGVALSDLIGVFVFSAALTFIFGVTGFFEKIMNRIPVGIASAMLAGVLLHFAFDVFNSMKTQMFLSLSMFLIYVLGRRFFQRYNLIVVVIFGIMIAWLKSLLHFVPVDFSILHPVFTKPSFHWAAIISVGIPLFVVNMSSQNLTGVAVLRAYGYQPEVSKLVTWSGLLNIFTAPFGGYSLNISALTAAICMGPEAHQDEKKRYTAALAYGLFYVLIGIFSSAVVSLFATFPKELIVTIAGLALISTISSGIINAVHHEEDREASLITFFVTASGFSLLGIGAAFWGLVAGALVSVVLKYKK